MTMNNTTRWDWLPGRTSGRDTVEGPDSAALPYGKVMIRGSNVTTEAHATTFRTSTVSGNWVIWPACFG